MPQLSESDAKTLDGNAAFLYGVNLIVSQKDLGSFQQIYRDASTYHDRLYGATQDIVWISNDTLGGFTINGRGFPATAPIVAKVGEKIVVRFMNEGIMMHPWHLHGMPMRVVARDGYPLGAAAFTCDTLGVNPGVRSSRCIDADAPSVIETGERTLQLSLAQRTVGSLNYETAGLCERTVSRALESTFDGSCRATRRPPDPRLESRRAAFARWQAIEPGAHRRVREIGRRWRLAGVLDEIGSRLVRREAERNYWGTSHDEVRVDDRRTRGLVSRECSCFVPESFRNCSGDRPGVSPMRLINDNGVHASHLSVCEVRLLR